MQLFTIGTKMLNQDGTRADTTATICRSRPIRSPRSREFARVYTGWTYAPPPGQPVQWGAYITQQRTDGPLSRRSTTPARRQLLNGYVGRPPGITPQQDLNNALDNIFNHPNVGPFVGKQLIQHLVKSNPSPAYISRVAAAFNNNGQGVPRRHEGHHHRDSDSIPKPRANDNGGADQPADGHLQEPALFIAGMVRAFGGTDDRPELLPVGPGQPGPGSLQFAQRVQLLLARLRRSGHGAARAASSRSTRPTTRSVRANVVRNLFSQ